MISPSAGRHPLSPACLAIVHTAVEWVIARVVALPEPQRAVQQWPEYPALKICERALNDACLSGDEQATTDAARAYCAAWLEQIKRRRPIHTEE